MRKITLMIVLMASILFTGCLAPRVPETVIQTPFGEFRGPKDMDIKIDDLVYVRMTNGIVKLQAKAIRTASRNNPDVIGASTEQIQAHYNGASRVIGVAIEKGIAAGTKAAVPVP